MERSAWHRLGNEGSLICRSEHVSDDPIFQNAYAWMKSSMIQAGLPAPAADASPWWCWVRRDENHPGPYTEDYAGPDDPVVLQLSIPSHLVVLSCFDLWHFVLNRWYVGASEADEHEFVLAWGNSKEDMNTSPALEERLQNSWSAIFELDQNKVDMGRFEAKSIQGCFWILQCDHVVGVMESAKLDSYQHPHQLLENGMEESLDQAAEDG
ncbi:DUF3841 domain-containing protein [Pseudomonas savastanoi]|nr:DUF3841 domain-containing protein [Pseudomonas savastanoi]EFW80201.1 hypothetical protein PsgB076_13677 [Pseudomonas savastanoi pv. glycinea str. B076]EFW84732.1 hypothetical protein PsgRace4_17938 [Pseudomonas savastanoi pv. glycinea str. race 4]EGH15946.1 hypothetical protein Pgy4_22881 [Pseudomonas savastanoi pv. glycinea str. race 4]MCQ3005988.1 DUF3841 domain-containing protein [Pseudomonas savastanoi]PYD21846.1 DUF3841 domain-containing protein [Pseudomonas savastanoi pv. glycinea]